MSLMETKASTHRLTQVALFVAAIALFGFNLEFPKGLNFDEFHYIPSAKQFLELTENQNYEHPPLAKELIAVGVGLFGDQPTGWRVMSVVFGALTLLGMYRLALVIFGTYRAALVASLLTLFNHMLYVQSRIAMLDTFMVAFLVWSWALALEGWRENLRPKLYWSGALMGWAVATKWFAIMPWMALLGLAAGATLFKTKKSKLPPLKTWLVAWILLPVAAYYSAFIPFFWVTPKDGGSYGLWDILFSMQYRMWDGQMRVVSPHNYGSHWWEWPLMLRPIWYAFDRENDPMPQVRGVLLIGNPMILWGGLVALGWTAWSWLKTRNRAAFWILTGWSVCYLSWPLIPRKLAFFYYYYPAALWLGLAWVYVIENAVPKEHRRLAHISVTGLTLLLFIHFFPILGALPMDPDRYIHWMWLKRWI